MSTGVYIAAGRRTAFGAFGGKLKSFTAAQVSSDWTQAGCLHAPALATQTHAQVARLVTDLAFTLQLGGFAGKAALADLPDGVKVDHVYFG